MDSFEGAFGHKKPSTVRVGECLIWMGRDGNGIARQSFGPYRRVYEEHYGPIPEGYHIDHLCCNRHCVEPTHLEAVTPSENRRRAYESAAEGIAPWLRPH